METDINQIIRLTKDCSKCDRFHEERDMRLERVLWRGDSEGRKLGRTFQLCAGGRHSKFEGPVAGWHMAER